MNVIKGLISCLVGLMAACAIITVNVYFPEKDVKQAYKSLDEMLLKQSESKPTETPAGSEQKKDVQPQSWLLPGFSLVTVAWAAENVADDLAIEVSSKPEVLKAYEEMKKRLPQIEALLTSGAIGESKQGILVTRDKARMSGKEDLVKEENDNRKIVITAMAKAILKMNKQGENKAAMNQVLPKAAASYATIRQDQAKKGWWVELNNGRWVQK
jgi:hypothetical protein